MRTKTNPFHTVFFILFLLFGLQNLYAGEAQYLYFTNLSVDQGLSQGNVNVVFQDSRGFIWVGTEDGLNRYNGYTFSHYKSNKQEANTISNNIVTDIKEDSKGNLWISTRNGLNLYNPKKESFTIFKSNNSKLTNNQINALEIDKNNKVWIGTISGLCFYNPETKTVEVISNRSNNSLLKENISSLKIVNQNQLWLGTLNKGLFAYNTESNTPIKIPSEINNAINSANVRTINVDTFGKLWIGTFTGLLILNKDLSLAKQCRQNAKDGNELSSNEVYSITFDDLNNAWVATDKGLCKISNDQYSITKYIANNANEFSLSQNSLRSVIFDKDKRIWIGSMFGGVDVYDPHKNVFKHWSNQKNNNTSISHNNVQNFANGNNENYWVATDGGGISKFNAANNTFLNYKPQKDNANWLNSNKVIALCNDGDNLWLGSWDGGVMRFNPKTNQFKAYPNVPNDNQSMSSNHIFYIFKDSKNRLWIATWDKGINLYDREKDQFKRLFHEGDMLIPEATFMVEDNNGFIWIASQGAGLFKFNPQNFNITQFKNDENKVESLSSDIVYSLYFDSKNRLWAGTKNGLNLHLGNGTFKAFTTNDGLPNNLIYSIEEDHEGKLWLGTNYGISCFNTVQNKFRNFTQKDGLQGSQFNRRAVHKLPSGEILFGGTNGYNLIDPRNIKENTIPPTSFITQLKIGNKIIETDRQGILENAMEFTNEIILNHKQNFIAFNYFGLNYTQSEKNQYQYILEGLEQEWSNFSTQKSASYTNLNPGEYTFRLLTKNSDGVVANQEAKVNITIVAPWWQQMWFKILVIVFVLSISYTLYIIRANALKRQKQLLQETVNNRTKDLKNIMRITKEQSNKISALGETLKLRSEALASGVESQTHTASSIELSIDNLAQHTSNTQTNAKKTDSITEKTLSELGAIKESTEKNISEIQSIANKTNILNDIFRQTNILAINAAIEAQHAGVHGKGFGTVAEEVRKLADKSKEAADEIMKSSKNGAKATQKDGERLIEFIPEINKVAQLIKEISDASIEQHANITNITASLKEFFKTSHDHSATAKEIASISLSLDDLASYLKEHMDNVEL